MLDLRSSVLVASPVQIRPFLFGDNMDEKIHKHNLTLKLPKGKEEVAFELTSRITGETIKVILKGDILTCKDCRDKILWGSFNWSQGSLQRKKLLNYTDEEIEKRIEDELDCEEEFRKVHHDSMIRKGE